METGWLRKSQWVIHTQQCPDCFMDWESFKRVWGQWCNKDMTRVLPEAKKIAERISKRIERRNE